MEASPIEAQVGLLLLNASWQAGLLAVVVAAICQLAGSRIGPRWQFMLWGLVFVRLAFPLLPSSPLSVWNLLAASDQKTFVANKPTPAEVNLAPSREGDFPPPFELSPETESSRSAVPQDISSPPRDVSTAPQEPIVSADEPAEDDPAQVQSSDLLWWAAVGIWGIVAGILLVRQCFRWRRLLALKAAWEEVTDEQILQVLEDCRCRCGIRRPVRLLQSDRPVGPATLGFLRPSIVLPESLIRSLDPGELRMVFLHEMSHILRLDVLWDQLAAVLAAVHWFNPAAWWALLRLGDARELTCDAAVLSHLGPGHAKPYGELIVNLASRRPQTALVSAAGAPRLLHRRIKMIATYRKSTWKHSLLGAMVLLALAAGGLTSAQTPNLSEPGSNANKPRQEAKAKAGKNQQEKGKSAKEYAINGTCTDEEKHPLEGVRVRLFRVDSLNLTRELVKEIKTDAAGKFQFENLPAPVPYEARDTSADNVYYQTYYLLAATKRGRTSRLNAYMSSRRPTQNISIQMPEAGTLSGRVIDEKGRPVKGAKVYLVGYPAGQPVEGVFSDTTNADGTYSISDLHIWDVAKQDPRKSGGKVTTHCYFNVRHPDFGEAKPFYTKIPSTVDVTLNPAAVIEGQLIDRTTGKPAASARVSMQGVDPTIGYQKVTTDQQGRYRLTSVAAGKYNIWADAEKRTCIAIDSLEVQAGKTYSNQNIPLVEGGWLEGRITEAKTGKPLSEWDGRPLRVAAYGPARPKSGAAVVSAPVDKNGRFGLRVGPGKNFPYIMTSEVWKRTEVAEKFREGIEVKDGELVVLDFKVLEEVPRKKPRFSPVRLSIPVPEEREAAAAIRRLGGWYALDKEKHVVEVNMVYHETKDKVRYDNDQAVTDEALQWMPKFPRLKRLFLKEGQATDESMRFVGELPELEIFIVWDAHKISDAGTQHLAKLKKLKDIHLGDSQIGDGTLKVFGGLPNLERLSLQKNYFTDAGVANLTNLKSLKSLWIGMGKGKLTEKIAPDLAKLTNLEELDLQRVPLTDEAVEKLKPLTKLRLLLLHGTPDEDQTITDASVPTLISFKRLESLQIQNCRMTDEAARKLAALPHLKRLSLEGTKVTPETKADLQKKYPDKWINLPLGSR